jgi:acetyl esterase/lipase
MRKLTVFIAALLHAAGAQAGEVAHPPVEAFGDLPLAAQPQLSPDGKHFATIQSIRGRPAAVIYTVGAPKDAVPRMAGSSANIVVGIQWAKNDRLFVTVNANEKGGTDRVHAWFRTVSIDAETNESAMLFSDSVWRDANTSASVVDDIDLDDPDHVYMPLYVPTTGMALYRVDVRTGKPERVMGGGWQTEGWIMDGHGQVAGRIEATERPLAEHLSVYENGDWRRIGDYDATEGHSSGVIGLNDDGTSFVRSAIDPATGMEGLLTIDRKTGAAAQLYHNDSYDMDEALTDPWTGRVIGVSYVDDKPEYVYFDPAMQALQRGLEAAFPGKSVHAVSWDLAKDELIVAVDGPRNPLAYYFLDRKLHVATPIATSHSALHEEDLGEMKPYPYKARDRLDIRAYLTLPPGKEPKNLPTIIMPHGGPMARDAIGFDWMAAFFANRGYAVLQPNFRGSSGYGENFLTAGYGQWGLKMQDDLTDGVKQLIADGIADPKRICIVGTSYGGYAALAGAALTPELYACAVGVAGVYDLRKFLRTRAKDYGGDSWMIQSWQHYIGNRYEDSDKLDAASPARHAGAIKCPVLLMHGAGDTTVRPDQSETMADALKSAGKDVQYITFDSDTHYMLLADTRIRFLKETEAFLKKNIGE